MDFRNRKDLPLGLRNNNPGNLRPLSGSQKWLGQVGVSTGATGSFCIFSNVFWGLRAMATDLLNDYRLKGLTTLTKLLSEYAPNNENRTAEYAAYVSRKTGIPVNATINMNLTNLTAIMRAMIQMEVGEKSALLIPATAIKQGIYMTNDTLKKFLKITAMGVAGLGFFLLSSFS